MVLDQKKDLNNSVDVDGRACRGGGAVWQGLCGRSERGEAKEYLLRRAKRGGVALKNQKRNRGPSKIFDPVRIGEQEILNGKEEEGHVSTERKKKKGKEAHVWYIKRLMGGGHVVPRERNRRARGIAKRNGKKNELPPGEKRNYPSYHPSVTK